jgi:acyl-CoA hydrolase
MDPVMLELIDNGGRLLSGLLFGWCLLWLVSVAVKLSALYVGAVCAAVEKRNYEYSVHFDRTLIFAAWVVSVAGLCYF